MMEPIYQPVNVAGSLVIEADPGMLLQGKREEALLWRATNLAIEGALRFGTDLPVGAVAAAADLITGRYFASDRRFGLDPNHAEVMAIIDSKIGVAPRADTVVVTIEPCDNCQDFLAAQGVKKVGFGLMREQVAQRGLVKYHDETIFERALRVGLPYEVVQIDTPLLQTRGGLILDFTRRNLVTGEVQVDKAGLEEALLNLKVA